MNDIEKKKISVYEEILTFLRENREVIAGIPGINSNILKLYRIMDEIRNTDKLVSSETIKRTLKINETREKLISQLLPILSALFRYAKDTHDVLLKERTKLSRSNLVLYKNYELTNKAILLSSLAEKNVKQLGKYGIRLNHISTLDELINTFHTMSSDSGSGPETAVFYMDKLFTQADTIITSLDEIIEAYVEDEVFYEEYLWVKEQDRESEEEEKEELLFELDEN